MKIGHLYIKKIKRSSRLDKIRWTQARLEEDHAGGPAQQWKTIRRVRSKYQLRTQTVIWPDGRPSACAQKAEVLAQHLKSNVWNDQHLPPPTFAPASRTACSFSNVGITPSHSSYEISYSYRPISLVNTICQLYATLLQQRLSASLEPRLSPQQFGFRKNRSLSPLFIIRRLLEIFERHIICFVPGLVPGI